MVSRYPLIWSLFTFFCCCWIAAAQPLQDPMKDPGPGTPKHRKRAEYFLNPRIYPLGFVPGEAVAEANRLMDRMTAVLPKSKERPLPGVSSTTWTNIGPQPTKRGVFSDTSGWTGALAVDPRNADVVYAGSPGGGLWKSTTGGANWTPLTDSLASNIIGSIALAPSNPDIVYAGTGDGVFNYGAGLLKSTNGGATWTLNPGPFAGPTGSTSYFDGGAKMISLAVDPDNPNLVLAGVFRWPLNFAGLYRSTDGGTSWIQVLSGGRGTSLFFDLTVKGTVWAAIGEYYGQLQNGVWKSTDYGVTWSRTSLPNSGSAEIFLRQGLNPPALYAAVASTTGNTIGVYRSGDNGASWNKLTIPTALGSRGVNIAVAPQNSNVVFAGDIDLFRSLDAGATWTNVRGITFADYRSFAFSNGGGRLYVGDDGGVWSTNNVASGAVTWLNHNTNLSLALLYPGMALHPTDINIAMAGAQDQGIQRYSGALAWENVQNCDGGWSAIDFVNPTIRYADCQYIDVYKSTNSGASGSWIRSRNGISTSDTAIFIPPLVMDPGNSSTLYYGTNRVYQTVNGASLWTAISQTFNGPVTSIAVAPSDRNTVYAVTEKGSLYLTTNALSGSTSTWTLRTVGLPNRAFTNLAIDPTNPLVAYVTVSGFTFGSDRAGHVFRTSNAGQSWVDISANLPNTPANDIAVDPAAQATLYLATDVGVFVSVNTGSSWAVAAAGLPRVIVTSIRLHSASRTLRAGTFGRGAWDLSVPLTSGNPVPVINALTPSTAAAGAAAFTLTVSGASFVSGATVQWNGSARATTFVDAATLRASINSSDITNAGAFPVTVVNPTPGGGTSNTASFTVTPVVPPSGNGSYFVPIVPCRAADTRSSTAIGRLTTRAFGFSNCGVPSTATALALNVTVVPIQSLGYLSIWPAGQPQPTVSTLNSLDGRIKANAAIVGAGTNGQVSVFVTDTAHVILDVNGYFVPAGTAGALAFYPASPCRALDTRVAGSGGALAASETRRIPGGSGAGCLSTTAQAYSLNVTVVPPASLGYLTLWPDQNSQPLVSTLNDLTGTIVANAAVLRAGSGGAVNVFVTDATHLLVDLNGYFAPPGSPGALAFYPVQPCRVSDTRNGGGTFGGPRLEADTARNYPITSSGCSVPAGAQAFVLNATVIPPGLFGFLTLWPSSQSQPTVSTLNAVDASLTSNMAIVVGSSGEIRAYANSAAHLLLDVSGYFAP